MTAPRHTNPYASPLAADEPPDKLPPPVPPPIRWETYPALLMGGLAIGQATGGCAGLLAAVAEMSRSGRMLAVPASNLTVGMLLLVGAGCGAAAAWCWWHRHWRTAASLTTIDVLLAAAATHLSTLLA